MADLNLVYVAFNCWKQDKHRNVKFLEYITNLGMCLVEVRVGGSRATAIGAYAC